ncbi:MAG: hypothetical protein JOS17DRAFT_204818 [Linnemannia elongata]|nr:MAG: hypothetical protein JOS17DRAFT_204818 [Linnemannia elongata]
MHSWPFFALFFSVSPLFSFCRGERLLLGALIHDEGNTRTKRVVTHAIKRSIFISFGTQWITRLGRQSLDKLARKKKKKKKKAPPDTLEWRERLMSSGSKERKGNQASYVNDVSVQGG